MQEDWEKIRTFSHFPAASKPFRASAAMPQKVEDDNVSPELWNYWVLWAHIFLQVLTKYHSGFLEITMSASY